MEFEEYKDLSFIQRRELDQEAYTKYYESVPFEDPYCTFNGFYGTETHRKFLLPLLRKFKLEQIKKVSE